CGLILKQHLVFKVRQHAFHVIVERADMVVVIQLKFYPTVADTCNIGGRYANTDIEQQGLRRDQLVIPDIIEIIKHQREPILQDTQVQTNVKRILFLPRHIAIAEITFVNGADLLMGFAERVISSCVVNLLVQVTVAKYFIRANNPVRGTQFKQVYKIKPVADKRFLGQVIPYRYGRKKAVTPVGLKAVGSVISCRLIVELFLVVVVAGTVRKSLEFLRNPVRLFITFRAVRLAVIKQ